MFSIAKEGDTISAVSSEIGYCKIMNHCLLIIYPNALFSLSSQSRSVRNAVASFIWTTKRDDLDFKFLRKVSHCHLH